MSTHSRVLYSGNSNLDGTLEASERLQDLPISPSTMGESKVIDTMIPWDVWCIFDTSWVFRCRLSWQSWYTESNFEFFPIIWQLSIQLLVQKYILSSWDALNMCTPRVQPVLSTKCTPLSVEITSLIFPTSNPYAASSNGFCIWPRPNQPRSPSFSWEEQSECNFANSANFSEDPLISASWPRKISMASSFERVIFAYSVHE